MMTNVNSRGEFQHQRPEPEGDLVEIQVGDKPEQVVKVGKNLSTNVMKSMTKVLQDNEDIFAWVASDMAGVDLEFCCHRLVIREGSKPMPRRKGEWAKKEQRPLKRR
jgi:hypothetical protein